MVIVENLCVKVWLMIENGLIKLVMDFSFLLVGVVDVYWCMESFGYIGKIVLMVGV